MTVMLKACAADRPPEDPSCKAQNITVDCCSSSLHEGKNSIF